MAEEQTPSEDAPQAPGFDWSEPPAPKAQAPVIGSTDSLGILIPIKNSRALLSYYMGVFSLIPCFGYPMAIAALILGFLGLKAIKEHPELPGKAHAWVGIVIGGLSFLGHTVLLILILINARPS